MNDQKKGEPTPKAPQNGDRDPAPQNVIFVFESTTFPTFNWNVRDDQDGNVKLLELTVPQTGKQMVFPFGKEAAKKLGMALIGSGIEIPDLDLSRLKDTLN